MADKKLNTEDTVKDILETGVDFRPRFVTGKVATDNVIKPNNFDGIYVTNTTGSTTLALSSGNNTFTHHLGRTPEGFIVIYKDANEDIYKGTTWDDNTFDLGASGSVNAKVIIF